MGGYTTASGHYSTAMGRHVKAGPASYTMVLGNGPASGDTLINNTENSLMVGFNSDIPTLFVGPSSGVGTTGKVGIGTHTPSEKLHVAGNAHVTGEITREFTVGTSNLATPIAYAFIGSDGTVFSGTPNVSCSWNGTSDQYEITISGESYVYYNYVTQVTISSNSQLTACTSSVSNNLIVKIFDSGGSLVQSHFQFVTYKP
jgi:hypothetical protein